MAVALTVNGIGRHSDRAPVTPLLDVLRADLGLTGTRFGCGEGECGACMVLVDGLPQPACNLPLWAVEGKAVVTVEGIGTAANPHPVQQAILDAAAGQCGFCLAGIVVSAAALLARNADPSRADICAALDRNLCRCGSHHRIIAAVTDAAARMRAAGP